MVDEGFFNEIHRCRICRGGDLQIAIDLGDQALTGRFPAAGEPDPPRAPLVLVRCTDCGLVQLKHSVTTGEMFGDNYGYRSGINATMRSHLAGIATTLATRASLDAGDVALDIGCNDGTLLNSYETQGLARLGIDPVADMFRPSYPKDITVHTGFFSEQAFRAISPTLKAKVVTSLSMFYDLEDPVAFVADIASVLDPEGIWVLEQSYLPTMLAHNSFDTICHEHLEYYALQQIEYATRARGLRIFDVTKNGINGGSFQLWACHQDASHLTDGRVAELRATEEALGLKDDATYAAFRKRVAAVRIQLRDLVIAEAGRGKKIYGYGASTKGNVLLQYCGLDHRYIRACADRNPVKWGRRTPGTAIPIVSEEEARADADYFLVLPWHFKGEFLARESDFRRRAGKLIFPLPEVEVC